jgi:hypothetical protein
MFVLLLKGVRRKKKTQAAAVVAIVIGVLPVK